jgi:hypothetical protein
MGDPTLAGNPQHVLVPRSFGRHRTDGSEFTVLSVEIWTTGLVVNLQLRAAGARSSLPRIVVEDHWGTVYTRKGSATLGARQLQYFEPSVPDGIRSLTIKCEDSRGVHEVLFVAVPAQRALQGGRLRVHHPGLPPARSGREREAG